MSAPALTSPIFGSITLRILWLHVITAVVGAIMMPLALYVLLSTESEQIHHAAMADKAARIVKAISLKDPRGIVVAVEPEEAILYLQAYDRLAYAVRDEGGAVLASSRTPMTPIFPQPFGASDEVRDYQTRAGAALLSGVRRPAEIDGRRLWVEVAENMSHRDVLIDDVLVDFIRWIVWTSLVFFGIILVVDVAVVRRAFRPVLQASALAKQIAPGRTDIRLDPGGVPREVAPLVVAVNEAIDRLEAGLRAQRDFAADAAHELRTPLAILRARVDTLPDKQASALLSADVAAMSRTVQQLLELAEVEAYAAAPFVDVDLHEVCAEVVEFIAPLAISQGRDISLNDDGRKMMVRGDPGMVARAVRNLVENAMKHTPAGQPVQIALEPPGAIIVRDAGEGIRPQDAEHLFQRFWRRDRQETRNAGLGLAIVKRIMELHGGQVTVRSPPEGGAEFRLTFS
ncbi:MAG: Two-component sensor histidine kinase [Hyphomicrobiales bacterium]|nr:Two-component sensor histidine kinase [Hyphomicrobiales bacterium]